MKENILDRIKLLMEYNLRETFDQNKKRIINEESEEQKIAKILYDEYKSDGTDEERLTKAIESIKSSTQFWNVNAGIMNLGTFTRGTQKFRGPSIESVIRGELGSGDAQYIKRISDHLKKLGINNNPNLRVFKRPGYKDTDIYDGKFQILSTGQPTTPTTTTPTTTSTQRQTNINNTYCSVRNNIITAKGSQEGVKWDDYVRVYKLTTEEIEAARKACANQPVTEYPSQPTKTGTDVKTLPTVTIVAPPKALKNAEGVKAFQDWLDTNKKGWYKGGELNKGGGYGKFGPSTKSAWNTYKDEYASAKNIKMVSGVVGDKASTSTSIDVKTPTIKTPTLPTLQSNVTGEQIYKTLYDGGNLEGAGKNRIKVKIGIPIADESLLKLDQYLSTLGYNRIKQDTEKVYGSKYVWSK